MQAKLRKFYDDFGTRISILREKRGLTLGDLAAGTASTAKSWEEGSLPSPDKWEAIAKRLRLSVSFVFLGKPTSKDDFDFIAKFTDEIGQPPYEEGLAEGPQATYSAGEIDISSSAEALRVQIVRYVELSVSAAGNDVGKLGWLREQLLRHLTPPPHWHMPREISPEAQAKNDAAFAEAARLAKERRGERKVAQEKAAS